MTTARQQFQKVAAIVMNLRRLSACRQASPNEAAEIDQAYAEYLDLLPKRTGMIRQGQKEWERQMA